MDENELTINQRIEHRRTELGLTKTDCAKKLDINIQRYSSYENSSYPPANVIRELAEILQTSADYLFGITDVPITLVKAGINNQMIKFLATLEEKGKKFERLSYSGIVHILLADAVQGDQSALILENIGNYLMDIPVINKDMLKSLFEIIGEPQSASQDEPNEQSQSSDEIYLDNIIKRLKELKSLLQDTKKRIGN